jgi:hypothetical protein
MTTKITGIRKKINKACVLFICLLFLFNNGYSLTSNDLKYENILHFKNTANDTVKLASISTKTSIEIKYQAELVVQTLESVLNNITFNDNTQSELNTYIKNSYTSNQRNRVFYSNKIIIEDDINPKYSLSKNRDLRVDDYLNLLDLTYEKTADFSIKFSNIKSSNVKKTNYIYVRVKFDANFNSKYKVDGSTYPTRQREALVRMEPQGTKKWNAFIEGISYYNPNKPIESKDNDLPVQSDFDGNSIVKNTTNTNYENVANLNESSSSHYRIPDFQIKFKNLKYAEIKKMNPVFYLKMKFDTELGDKFSEDGSISQQIKQGEVLVCMQQNGRKIWNGFIEAVTYDSPEKLKDNKIQDIEYASTDGNIIARNIKVLNEVFKRLALPLKPVESEQRSSTK